MHVVVSKSFTVCVKNNNNKLLTKKSKFERIEYSYLMFSNNHCQNSKKLYLIENYIVNDSNKTGLKFTKTYGVHCLAVSLRYKTGRFYNPHP